ncbi:TATA box-binding protein-associated factor, RNA polymerase I, subunit C-like [Anolis sagrei]|uniref:TATA box-binding protein-associated factor, RNA polymerase I, subunit C-like n=1 Tax=Anolis sagrei TaxID=38937 RepID=UPI00351FBB93
MTCIAAALVPGGHHPRSLVVFHLSEAGDLFFHPMLCQEEEEEEEEEEGRQEKHLDAEEGEKGVPVSEGDPPYVRWLKAFLAAWEGLPWDAQGRPPTPSTLSQAFLFKRGELQEGRDEARCKEARRHLRRAMEERGLLGPLGDGAPSPPLPPPEIPPLKDLDELSERMEASWGGGWGGWWQDKLGRNLHQKRRDLRERRRRAKRARGPASLSGSFVSSTSGPSEFSDSSCGASRPRPRRTPAPKRTESPPLPSQEAETETEDPLGGLLSSQTLSAKGIPRERRRTLRQYLALWDPQKEEEGEGDAAAITQDPQADPPGLPLSQASRGTTCSQGSSSSQRAKKKARMGF